MTRVAVPNLAQSPVLRGWALNAYLAKLANAEAQKRSGALLRDGLSVQADAAEVGAGVNMSVSVTAAAMGGQKTSPSRVLLNVLNSIFEKTSNACAGRSTRLQGEVELKPTSPGMLKAYAQELKLVEGARVLADRPERVEVTIHGWRLKIVEAPTE